MAQKSKTQRAKASARRAEKREAALLAEDEATQAGQEAADSASSAAPKRSVAAKPADASKGTKVELKKPDKAKKESWIKRNTFIQGVRTEMRRVTWPSRQDVLRWSGVVVVALLFFSAFVFVLDNWVVTPLLLLISTLGA